MPPSCGVGFISIAAVSAAAFNMSDFVAKESKKKTSDHKILKTFLILLAIAMNSWFSTIYLPNDEFIDSLGDYPRHNGTAYGNSTTLPIKNGKPRHLALSAFATAIYFALHTLNYGAMLNLSSDFCQHLANTRPQIFLKIISQKALFCILCWALFSLMVLGYVVIAPLQKCHVIVNLAPETWVNKYIGEEMLLTSILLILFYVPNYYYDLKQRQDPESNSEKYSSYVTFLTRIGLASSFFIISAVSFGQINLPFFGQFFVFLPFQIILAVESTEFFRKAINWEIFGPKRSTVKPFALDAIP
ncbi:unnamed protein product [Caenorhabditis angaria]|uniref:Uncharacterized protein n=1 Tax=Caenorhabditis angaria TaxID=860376 RepID=A0A9P1MX54_9PELO|nr:unnamed protein product [Caenorhabditis angaria]